MRPSTYLSLSTLYDEIQACIVQEMHGLFHAFLTFPEYEALTSGAWGTERGTRRGLVGLFFEGLCTNEFASLPQQLREGLLKSTGKRTTPSNALPLLFAAEHAPGKISTVIDAWAADVKEIILLARKGVDDAIRGQSDACFNSVEWNEIMERDGSLSRMPNGNAILDTHPTDNIEVSLKDMLSAAVGAASGGDLTSALISALEKNMGDSDEEEVTGTLINELGS